jgi:hypothetical protein
LSLLTAELTVGAYASNILRIPLFRRRTSNRGAPILLIWLVVDLLSLTDQVLIVIRQPARKIYLGGGRGVLRLAATTHVRPRKGT